VREREREREREKERQSERLGGGCSNEEGTIVRGKRNEKGKRRLQIQGASNARSVILNSDFTENAKWTPKMVFLYNT
jgi:hypothetical protein